AGGNALLHGRRLDLGGVTYSLLYLQPSGIDSASLEPAPPEDVSAQAEIDRLLEDLVYTRESLQTAVEQQETVNEELNATNEELLAANEELQSTNEELSSVNEELLTLNDEHQRRLEEVLQVTADLEVLLASTSIAAILLNQDGTIRRITEAAKPMFGVRDSDIGRPLADLATNLDREALLVDIRDVAHGGDPVTRPVSLSANSPQRLLVDRYQLPHDAPGVFIAIFSSNIIGPAEQAFRAILDAAPVALYAKDADGVYIAMNEYGGARIEGTVGQTDHEIFSPEVADQITATDDLVRSRQEIMVRHERPVGPDGVFDVISVKFPMPDNGLGGVAVPVTADVRDVAAALNDDNEIRRLRAMIVDLGGDPDS
ncbi:MAG: PAS domain-containing protein, partial [Actinomycetota bacterium]